jgi:hypothetical protein
MLGKRHASRQQHGPGFGLVHDPGGDRSPAIQRQIGQRSGSLKLGPAGAALLLIDVAAAEHGLPDFLHPHVVGERSDSADHDSRDPWRLAVEHHGRQFGFVLIGRRPALQQLTRDPLGGRRWPDQPAEFADIAIGEPPTGSGHAGLDGRVVEPDPASQVGPGSAILPVKQDDVCAEFAFRHRRRRQVRIRVLGHGRPVHRFAMLRHCCPSADRVPCIAASAKPCIVSLER